MKRLFRRTVIAFAAASAVGAWAWAGATVFTTIPSTTLVPQGYVHLVGDGQDKFCHMEKRGHLLHDVCYTRAALKERLLAALRPEIVDLEVRDPSIQSAGYMAAGRPGD
jgi:hypothetical protein